MVGVACSGPGIFILVRAGETGFKPVLPAGFKTWLKKKQLFFFPGSELKLWQGGQSLSSDPPAQPLAANSISYIS